MMAANLDRMLTLPSVQAAACRTMGEREAVACLERQHPDFRVMAGPYAVCVANAAQQRAEKAACVRVVKDQRRAGVALKVIMVGEVAYVLRSREGWRYQGDDAVELMRSLERSDW